MAQLTLSRAEAERGNLPRVCMQCGGPATETMARKYSTDKMDLIPPPPEPVGCLVLFPILSFLKLLSWSSSKSMTVLTPLCHDHAHGWFKRNTLAAKAITDECIILEGGSDVFAQAWDSQRPLNVVADQAHREVVKVRCRHCQALNDETAKFCNQCSAAI